MRAWEQFLQQQETELGPETVNKWLRSLKVLRFDACNLYLEAKDTFQSLWFEEHMRAVVQTRFVNGNHKRIKVHLSVVNTTNAPAQKTNQGKARKESKGIQFQLTFEELDPLFQFTHFIPGRENDITYQILCEAAGISQPGQLAQSGQPSTASHSLSTFNPIYLFGPRGSGKTHLLMSLARSFATQKLKTLYVRAELFTAHVVAAIRAGEMSTFRQAYRNADVLIVDDVHVFSRKGATQEEFFHTFNTLHLEGKQIILSANCAPQDLQLIEPRLVSRFEWGIVLQLRPLEEEDLKKMLRAKAQAMQVALPVKIIDFLCSTFTSNPKNMVKALEALLLRLHADAQLSMQNLSIVAVKTLLSDLIIEEQKVALTSQKVIQGVSEHYGIRPEDILGKSQTRECALPRQIAMHLCRDKLKMPYMKIGELFSRDNSTVMTSVKYIQTSKDQGHREIAGAWYAIAKKLTT